MTYKEKVKELDVRVRTLERDIVTLKCLIRELQRMNYDKIAPDSFIAISDALDDIDSRHHI